MFIASLWLLLLTALWIDGNISCSTEVTLEFPVGVGHQKDHAIDQNLGPGPLSSIKGS